MDATPRTAHGTDLALLISRIALVAIHLISGIGMIENLGMLELMLRMGGVPMPALLAVGAATVQLGAAIGILIGWRVRGSAIALIGFTAVSTLVMHPFWAAASFSREDQFLHFMKNVGLAGGLLALAAAGPGRFSVCRVMPGPLDGNVLPAARADAGGR